MCKVRDFPAPSIPPTRDPIIPPPPLPITILYFQGVIAITIYQENKSVPVTVVNGLNKPGTVPYGTVTKNYLGEKPVSYTCKIASGTRTLQEQIGTHGRLNKTGSLGIIQNWSTKH